MKLFDYLYGLRCIQLLALALQIDILERWQLLAKFGPSFAQFEPQKIEFSLANSAIRVAFKVTPGFRGMQYQSWSADLTAEDRTFLYLSLWNARKELFQVCGQVPGIQGWIIVFVAIWLPLVQKPTEM